jgi:hypothetical protein
MQTATRQYDTHNPFIQSIVNPAGLAGTRIAVRETKEKNKSVNSTALSAYQQMFGKRKGNKYTDNEIFIFNSKLNASKAFAKYL